MKSVFGTGLLCAGLLAAAPAAVGVADGPDVLIRNGTIVATAADYEMNGTMWVAFTVLEDSTTYVYKSLGHGTGWEQRFNMRRYADIFDKLQLVVGEGDSGFVYLFFLINHQGGDLWQVCFREGGSPVQSPVAVGPDTIADFAVCRDYIGPGYRLYAALTNPGATGGYRALRFLRSTDRGGVWAVVDSYSVQVRDPFLAAGAGQRIFFGARSGWLGGSVHAWTNRRYLDPSAWSYGLWDSDSDAIADPVIAAAFTLPESTATVWALWSQNYRNSGDWDVKYCYSTDGGIAWSTPAFLAGSAADDESYPDLRNYTSPGNPYVNASYIADDNAVRRVHRRYAHAASPAEWSDTLRINQGSAGTGPEVRPKLCYSPGGPFTGAGCVFVGAGLTGCWWNAPYPVGVEEATRAGGQPDEVLVEPSIGRAPFRIRTGPRAAVAVYDRSGRAVRTLAAAQGRAVWDGTDDAGRRVPEGVYLVRPVAAGCSATGRLTLLR